MLGQYYQQIETITLYLALTALFVLMTLAVHDVLKKNNVPKTGRYVAYGVLFLGAAGFLIKGVIELVWLTMVG